MTTLYKLTTKDNYTRKGETNQCLWGEGVTHSGTGRGDLCGPGYIHAYTHPLLAVLLNPIHADFPYPVLWEAEGDVVETDRGLKVGCVSLTTVRRLETPLITTEQRVRFAILCAWEVCRDAKWRAWAAGWLDGSERSKKAAAEAKAAASAAAAASAWAARAAESAEEMAPWAAEWAAARAAKAAAGAAGAAEEWAAWAAWAVQEAAWAAAAATRAAPLDLIGLAISACQEGDADGVLGSGEE